MGTSRTAITVPASIASNLFVNGDFPGLSDKGVEIHVMSADEGGGMRFRKGWLDRGPEAVWFINACENARNASKEKSEWIHEARHEQKLKAAKGIVSFRNGPAWCDLVPDPNDPDNRDADRWVENEHANTVRLIYELSAGGLAPRRITEYLDEHNIPCFGKSGIWKVSYVHELLTTRRVLGEFQPMTIIAYKNGEKNFDKETGLIVKETDRASGQTRLLSPDGHPDST